MHIWPPIEGQLKLHLQKKNQKRERIEIDTVNACFAVGAKYRESNTGYNYDFDLLALFYSDWQ